MAATVSGERKLQFFRGDWDGGPVVGIVDITGDASYPTGGYALAASDIDSNLNEILGLSLIMVKDGAAATFGAVYDKENGKLILIDEAGAQITGSEDLTGFTASFLFIGQ